MNNLSTVLSNISNGVTATARAENISATLQHGLIKAGGKMTTGQMIAASQPREQPITLDRAKQAWQWLRQLKQHRKNHRHAKWNDEQTSMEWICRSEYALPEGMTKPQVINGLIECLRPCSPMVVQHFVRLQACKPFFETDAERMQIIFDCLYDDLKEFPEVAVILGIDEVRQAKGKYFPSMDEITSEVLFYRDMIYDALDFFKGDKH